ncbi:MAG: DNA/RNA non-specific endonuclease [Janthinobacterium lividum]
MRHTPRQPRRPSLAARASGSRRDRPETDRRPRDHGGHYVAPRFDGPTDAFNHFAQDANFNTGPYRVMEDKWAKAVRNGSEVTVTITPSYAGTSTRPSELTVYTLHARFNERHFHNEHQGKPSGKQ